MADSSMEEESGFHGINVTPLVDVSLVLVLIFMVTSPFFAKALMPVSLPQARSAESEDQKNITVSMAADGRIEVNEVPVQLQGLREEINKQMDKTGFSFVLIRADERVLNGDIQDVMRAAKQANVSRVAFATTTRGN